MKLKRKIKHRKEENLDLQSFFHAFLYSKNIFHVKSTRQNDLYVEFESEAFSDGHTNVKKKKVNRGIESRR